MTTKNNRKKIAAAISGGLVAILATAMALTAFAQTSTVTGAGVSANITNTKTRDDSAITLRINSLNALLTRLGEMVRVSSSTKASISATIQTELTDMANLKAQIDADTSTSTLKTDSQSITKAYRIYALVLPQGRLTALADRVDTIVGMMTTVAGKFQTRITAAQSAGDNVSAEISVLADYNAKISDAQTQANAASSEIANLQPDQGNQTILQSNNQTLADARAKLKTASSDLIAARQDAGTLLTDLKSLKIGTSSSITASTTASTSTQ
jgi:hypothetical protein